MTIKELIVNIRVKNIRGEVDQAVTAIHFDSRKVVPGSVFVAVKGRATDGHMFIDKAVDRGAVCVITEESVDHISEHVCVLTVENSAEVLAKIAGAFYDHPSRNLTMVGVTGTNGKTTVAVQETLARMIEAGCTHAFMEVSSHALDQHRVDGIAWDVAIFTNITHDHLDYHGDFKTYIQAKKIFFDGLSAQAFALINADDKHAEVMVQNTVAKVSNYSLTKIADFRARVIENRIDGLQLEVNGIPLHVRLVGKFNASNLLAIYGAALLLGEDREQVLTGLSKLQPAEGRFDLVTGSKQVFAVVDYAHTPDALHNVLSTLIQVRQTGSRIICIVGCGGDRDRTKRPEMARIAATLADQVILTSDNSRTENPEDILDQMWPGVPADKQDQALRISDRKQAIRTGVMMAKPGDILLVAGKGHEKYQEINGHRFPFDDKKVLAEALA